MSTANPGSGGKTFASLEIRNYRLFFVGQLVSMCGTWMQGTAMSAYILYRLHGGGKELGFLSACTFTPMLLFGLWAGAVIDRVPKRRLLTWLQVAMGSVAAVQTVLVATGTARLWMIYVAAFLSGLANAFEMPARQAFVSEIVPSSQIANAVGLNSMIFNGGRVVGQALGGLLVPIVGYSWCFGVNAASYVAIVIGYLMMRTDELHAGTTVARSPGQVREGIRYVMATPVLRTIILLIFVVGTFSLNFQVFVPLLAKQIFHGGPRKVGWFQALVGVGSLAGSFLAARRGKPVARHMVLASAGVGLALGGAALAPVEAVALVALVFTGGTFITIMMTANTTLQLSSDPAMRGRVMAVYSFMFAGTTPLGAPFVGWVADRFGPRESIMVGSIAGFVAAGIAWVALRRGLLDAAAPSAPAPDDARPSPAGAAR